MNDATPSVSTTQRRKRDSSPGVDTYGSPVAATCPIIPSPSRKRARSIRSETPMPATWRSSPGPGSKRERITVVAPLSSAACSTIAR